MTDFSSEKHFLDVDQHKAQRNLTAAKEHSPVIRETDSTNSELANKLVRLSEKEYDPLSQESANEIVKNYRLNDLVNLYLFVKNLTNLGKWEVILFWKEPEYEDDGEWKGRWKDFQQLLNVDSHMLNFALRHHKYWDEKAHVPLTFDTIQKKK